MFTFVICVCLLSMATDVAHGRIVDLPQLPDGITVHNVLQIWEEAEVNCQSEGAILASPINENVFNAMKSLMSATRSTFYIGAKASQHPGRYVSLEGIPLENMTFAWHELDPSNGDCLAMTSEHLRVVPCETRLPYMCIKPDIFNKIKNETHTRKSSETDIFNKIKNETHTRKSSETDIFNKVKNETHTRKSSETCDDGYTYQGSTQHCYKVHREEVTWSQAQTRCIAEGGNLAIINNKTEAELIKNMYDFHTSPWLYIGLQQQTAGAGDWKWIDGRPVESRFNVWRFSERPKSTLLCATIDCVALLDDMPCHYKLPFVCAKAPTV